MNLKDLFKEYLKNSSMAFTAEREAVIEVLHSFKDHFTVEEILTYSNQNNKNISRATFYRTIQILQDAGLLIKIQRKDQPPVYELLINKAPHYHMICMKCGDLIEFRSEEIDKLTSSIIKEKSFDHSHAVIKIYGNCIKCQ